MKKWGAFLVDMLKLNQPGKGNARLIGELISLSAGKRTAVRNFYIHKMVVLTAVLLAGLLLSLLSFFFYEDGSGKEIQILERPGYGEGDRKEELTVQIEGQTEEQMLEVTVREQTYTDQEKKQLLEQAIAQLEELLPGENDSLDQVRSPLVLPQSLADGAVTVSWMTIPYGVIGDNGEVLKLKEIADIEMGEESYAYHGAMNGHPGISCMIFQTAGSNATEVNNKIDAFLEEEKEGRGRRPTRGITKKSGGWNHHPQRKTSATASGGLFILITPQCQVLFFPIS